MNNECRFFRNIFTALLCFCLSTIHQSTYAHGLEDMRKWCYVDKNDYPKDSINLNLKAWEKPKVGVMPGPDSHRSMNHVPLAEVDIAKMIPSLAGRNVRMRFWLMGPGGIIMEHCHEDRPAMVYLVEGQVKETKQLPNGRVVVNTLKAPQAVAEGNGTHHWWFNDTDKGVLMVAVDIYRPITPNQKYPKEKWNPPKQDSRLSEDIVLATFDFSKEYPDIPDIADYGLDSRRVVIKHGGKLSLQEHSNSPTLYYMLEGTLLEHRSDKESPLARQQGSTSIAAGSVKNYWENISGSDATLLIFNIGKE